jgi:ATP-dependent RNA helicase RhlE
LQAFEVDSTGKVELLKRLLTKEPGLCLVFTRTKRGADRLTMQLAREGFGAVAIHGNRSQSQRTAALNAFQQGRVRVLVATDLASRGIHVEDIAHVVNFDLPEIAEDFIHRVGRTGRSGGRGVASTIISRDQRSDLLKIERTLNIRIERVAEATLPQRQSRTVQPRMKPNPKSALVPLEGEFLQTQMEVTV